MYKATQMTSAIVNDEVVELIKDPSYKLGRPKIITTTGFIGSAPSVGHSRDYTDCHSEVKITIANTVETQDLIKDWSYEETLNVIVLSDEIKSETITFEKMVVSEDVEYGGDGDEVELTFIGAPVG